MKEGKHIIIVAVIAIIGLSGCREGSWKKAARDPNRSYPQWCETDYRPSARQIYECFRIFQAEDKTADQPGKGKVAK